MISSNRNRNHNHDFQMQCNRNRDSQLEQVFFCYINVRLKCLCNGHIKTYNHQVSAWQYQGQCRFEQDIPISKAIQYVTKVYFGHNN